MHIIYEIKNVQHVIYENVIGKILVKICGLEQNFMVQSWGDVKLPL